MVIKRVYFFIFLFDVIFFLSKCFSQIPGEGDKISDTLNYQPIDTLKKPPSSSFRRYGFTDQTVQNQIKDSSINFTNYQYGGDLLLLHPGFFIREFGGLGHITDILLNGNNVSRMQFSNDGIPLNDPWNGRYNLYLYPAENIERIEIVDGTRAFLYGNNSTGGVVNFVSKNKRSIKPYSRIRYSESGYGFSIIDGMLSQNLSRNFNITAGVQHIVFGERYANENYDGWNGRLKLRYDIGNRYSIFISEIHNKTNLGLPGGVNIEATPDSVRFDNLQAAVKNTDAYEKVTRNDFQTGLEIHPFDDSTSISAVTLYLTSSLREYRDEENRPLPNGIFIQQNQRSQWSGIKINNYFNLGSQNFTIGAEYQAQRILITPSTREERAIILSIFGKTEIPIYNKIILSPYAKYNSYSGEKPISYGGDIYFKPNEQFKLYGGYSRSYRFPNILERKGLDTIVSSIITDGTPERHHLMEAGITWTNSNWFNLNIKTFYRTIWNPIGLSSKLNNGNGYIYYYERFPRCIIKGINAGLSVKLSVILIESNFQYIYKENGGLVDKTIPNWTVYGGIYYIDRLFRDHLELKAGVKVTSFDAYKGYEFQEQLIDYLPENNYYNIKSNSIFDLVILARIGDAYFHVILDNLLNTNVVMNNFYPIHSRRLRFGVSWEFLD